MGAVIAMRIVESIQDVFIGRYQSQELLERDRCC